MKIDLILGTAIGLMDFAKQSGMLNERDQEEVTLITAKLIELRQRKGSEVKGTNQRIRDERE